MNDERPAVCVVGGGISGLVAAHTLARDGHARVVLLERRDHVGGVVRTDEVEGVPVEAGADSFLTRTPAAVELCRTLGLEDDLVAPAVFGALVWSGPRLVPLPEGLVFGMPSSPRAALTAAPLGPWGKARAALEPLLPGRAFTADESIGAAVKRRYGRQVLDRLVDPLLAGTRAGRPDTMSLEAALPGVWGAVRGRRSMTRGLARAAARGSLAHGPPPFKSVTGGLGRLVDALRAASTAVDVRTGTSVEEVAVAEHGGYAVRTSGGTVSCDGVVVAVPAPEAARVLAAVNPAAAQGLSRIAHSSVATVVLVYPAAAGSVPPGRSGLLVPSRERRTMSACTWYSAKWPAAAPADGSIVLRCFVGRAERAPALDLADDELVAAVEAEVREALGFQGRARTSRVTRWDGALPQYDVGHTRLVDEIDEALAETPGLWVTGASYRGAGLPDCIDQARTTAARALTALRAVG